MALICQICGKEINGKCCNAKYCEKCAEHQKKALDHEAYLRRRNRRRAREEQAIRRIAKDRKELEERLRNELGLSEYFFRLWKGSNKAFLKKWTQEQVAAAKMDAGACELSQI